MKLIGERYDDRYAYPGRFQLAKCPGCAHLSLQANFTGAELGNLYSNYYPRATFNVADFKPYTEVTGFAAWISGARSVAYSWVPKNVRVLDIGCGFGQSLAYHKARGCDVQGVEADENIRRVADAFGFNVHVGLFDPDIYAPGSFDYVTMNQVIEHVTDPLKVLSGLNKVLISGGTAVLTTPNAQGWCARLFRRYWINWHTPYHLQFFSRDSIRIAAEQAGLVVSEIRTVTNSEWLLYQWIHLLTYPEPGQPSPFWSPKHTKTPTQNAWIRLLYMIHRTKLNHLITRLFDAIGLGDNYVFVLKKP
jgi:SAM-dependent methyltransferase